MEEPKVAYNISPNWEEDVEVELFDESVKIMDKPFDPTKINIETKTPSLDTLIKRIERKSVAMNTEDYFQRKDDLWDVVKQSRLIESILIRFPLPAFFFDATDDNRWLIVDGLQRLSSIRNFCVNKTLKLNNLEFLTQLDGLGWEDLPTDFQRLIEESQVVIYKIMPGTPTDVKFNIFKRINTGGLMLEPQEIRHALFQGTPAKFIAELAKLPGFITATNGKISSDRMLDRDFANRFLAFYLFSYEDYQPDLDTFMSKAMAALNQLNEEQLNKIKRDFEEAMVMASAIFGREAFRKIYHQYDRLPPINKALFDTLSSHFAKLGSHEKNLLVEKDNEFRSSLYNKLEMDGKFFSSVTSSTGDRGKVLYRHKVVSQLINQTIAN